MGPDLGIEIFHQAEQTLQELIEENRNQKEKYIKWHLYKNMLPTISVYLVLKACSDTAEHALQYTDEILAE